MKQYVAGGAGKALMFLGDTLWGVGSTNSENSLNFSITGEDIRGSKGKCCPLY